MLFDALLGKNAPTCHRELNEVINEDVEELQGEDLSLVVPTWHQVTHQEFHQLEGK